MACGRQQSSFFLITKSLAELPTTLDQVHRLTIRII